MEREGVHTSVNAARTSACATNSDLFNLFVALHFTVTDVDHPPGMHRDVVLVSYQHDCVSLLVKSLNRAMISLAVLHLLPAPSQPSWRTHSCVPRSHSCERFRRSRFSRRALPETTRQHLRIQI